MDDLVFKELISRGRSKFRLEDYLFDKQLAFIQDSCPFKVANCSRRAGKSTGVAADLVMTALMFPECTALYITGTRADAKKIIWAEVLKFNRTYSLGGKPNVSELSVAFSNGSIVRLAGAKDEAEVEKIRGQLPPVKKAYIDEAQNIRDRVLVKLIDDVLEAALLDYSGSMALLGTPRPVQAGYFYRISHNLDDNYKPLKSSVWSVHHWTFFDNPHIARKAKTTHQALLERVLTRRGVTVSNPSIQREFFGKWENDADSLVVRYNAALNNYDDVPNLTHYVLGVDIGHDDADAIAVIGWNESSPKCYLVEEYLKRGQGITELADAIEKFVRIFNPVKVVIDTGGLGKKIAEELRRRRALPLVAAEKTRKFEFIELMNDALRTGNLMAKVTSQFAEDSSLLEWDKDAKLDKPKVKDTFHSDIIDAVLYAYREAMHWLYRPEVLKAPFKSPEYFAQLEAEMEEAARNSMTKKEENELEGFEPIDPFSKWPV